MKSDKAERSVTPIARPITSTPIASPVPTAEQFATEGPKATAISTKVGGARTPTATSNQVKSLVLEFDKAAKKGTVQARQIGPAVPTIPTKHKFPPTAKTVGSARADVVSARPAASARGSDRVRDLEVKIVSCSKDLMGVTRFAIVVVGPQSSHVVQRGYQEFRKLHRDMFGRELQEMQASQSPAPDMPSRSSCFSFMSPKFQRSRQERLREVVVAAVAAAGDADLIGCPPPLHEFLGLQKLVMVSADPLKDFQSSFSDMISTSASFDRTHSSVISPTEGDFAESAASRLAGLETLIGRTPCSLTAAAVAARLIAPPVNAELQRSHEIYDNQPQNFGNFYIDGFWLYDGHCIAHIADSHVHWLAEHLFTELRLVSFGQWSTEIDGHRFQLKARRPAHSVQLVWSDGTTWDRQELHNDETIKKSTIQEVSKDTIQEVTKDSIQVVSKDTIQEGSKDIQHTYSDCSDCSDAESELDEEMIKLLGDFGRHTQALNKLMTKAKDMKTTKKRRRKRPKQNAEDPAMMPFADRRARFEEPL